MVNKSDLISASFNRHKDMIHKLIEKKAYELYVKRGYAGGNDRSDWFQAEKMVMAELKK